VLIRETLSELTHEILGRSIMVGKVPGGEPGVVIGEHFRDRARRIDMAVCARYLPHAVEHAANLEVGSEFEAARFK